MVSEAQKRASKKYKQKNKQRILDNKKIKYLIEKINKPYNLKCKGILFCNSIHLLRKKREEQLKQVDDGKEHNFDELYKMIFKRDFKWKE